MNIWAHRGFSRVYPENTIAAFAAAAEYDICGVELDIQLTSDGHIVVIHDETVDRTTDGSGPVVSFSLEQIKQLNIVYGDEVLRIPTIEEVFDVLLPYCQRYGLLINIELKNSVEPYPGMEGKILDLVKAYGLQKNVIYSSFNFDSVDLIRQMDPDAEAGYLSGDIESCLKRSEETGNLVIHPFILSVNEPVGKGRVRCWNTRKQEPFYGDEREPVQIDISRYESLGVTDYITNNPDLYVCKRKLAADIGIPLIRGSVDPSEGTVITGGDLMVNEIPLKLEKGMRLIWKDRSLSYRAFFYSTDIDKSLIYEYKYQPESNWAQYERTEGEPEWRNDDLTADHDCYVRLVIDNTGLRSLMDAVDCGDSYSAPHPVPEAFGQIEEIRQMTDLRDRNYILLSDTHYAAASGFEQTVCHMRLLSSRIPLSGILHLGDLTDGITSQSIYRAYSAKVMNALRSIHHDVILAVGNHDSNYFRGNPEVLEPSEANRYLTSEPSGHYAHRDAVHKLAFVVLDSFDHRKKQRYGFALSTVFWLRKVLWGIPPDWKIVLMSHVPPEAKLNIWSDSMRNDDRLVSLLSKHQKKRGNILAFLSGHDHAEYVSRDPGFPVILLGCGKTEECYYKKPEMMNVLPRRPGDISADLFYVFSVSEGGDLRIFRFGAGAERSFYP